MVLPRSAASVERFRALKARVTGDNAIESFLRETCESFATAARMLAAVGTKDFYYHSVEIYGRPASLTADRKTTNLDLAQHFSEVVDGLGGAAAIPSPADELTLSAEEVVPLLTRRFERFFAGTPHQGRDRRRHRRQGGGGRRRRARAARRALRAARRGRSSSFTRATSTSRPRSTAAPSR